MSFHSNGLLLKQFNLPRVNLKIGKITLVFELPSSFVGRASRSLNKLHPYLNGEHHYQHTKIMDNVIKIFIRNNDTGTRFNT